MAACPHCGHEPPAGSAFCNSCGARLVIVCASCGATPPPGSRFCNGCGAALASPANVSAPAPSPTTEERKVISILFADLMGSTALQERLDPESVNRVMDAYYQAVRGPVEAGGGKVVQLLGDGVLCAFGIPRVAEDDLARIRAVIPENFLVCDQRRTGLGRVENADAWIASVAALYELSPDVRVDELYQLAVSEQGRAIVGRMSGTKTEGGEFESFFVRLWLYRNNQVARVELFELDQLGVALARFAEFGS